MNPVRRLLVSLIAGGLLCLAFPTFDVWVAAPLSLTLLAWAVTGLGAGRGLLAGVLFGLAFFVPTLSWSGIYVGALPWLALATLESLFIGIAGALYGWLSRAGRVRPLAFALVWVVTEGFRARAPYGGFPWLKLAFSQADSPVGRLVALGGAPFVGFVLALLGGLLALAVQRLLASRRAGSLGAGMPWGPVALPVAAALVLGVAGLAVPLPTDGQAAQFLGVQGNVPKAGLDFNAQRRAVLDNHVAATWQAQTDIEAGLAPTPDLVVWPENASDIDPVRNADARDEIAATVTRLGRPLVVGGLLEEPPGMVSNVSLLYEPGQGITDRYVKRHPVPFAEYIPNRSFFRMFSAEVDRVSRDFVAGPSVGVFDVTGTAGQQIRAGVAICFEVAYDDIMRDAVQAGANVLLVQTNNATFGYTAESPQQLAISRVRAMEFGRSVVHVSTVGQSALITPDGTAHQVTALFTQALVRGALPLRDATTVATRLGEAPEWAAAAALALLLVLQARGGTHRSGPAPRADDSEDSTEDKEAHDRDAA
ncbi:apolipoprotein N-acyltransferase [Humibacillus xanthopallidus]|uniref:Apolipoprotein N-acyltransferase n=1 Tax=Humibacillus xanthopallidus TaxID=412689 RepID=A0A543HIF1_9MICO|nr:apolipoprotein N-acyltransferase [Humibacillus xanthopallidus]